MQRPVLLSRLAPMPTGWVPRACTLPTAARPLRVAEFDGLFATAMEPPHRAGPTELVVRLPPGEETAARARELTARESACCSFFTFAVRASATGTDLEVRVPGSQSAVLDAMQQRVEAVRAG